MSSVTTSHSYAPFPIIHQSVLYSNSYIKLHLTPSRHQGASGKPKFLQHRPQLSDGLRLSTAGERNANRDKLTTLFNETSIKN
ncbi:hypothetical protein J6590_041875 [Homalodisca vitripennis]|nr:hypothetical protein J6590_041875 [Homalodisca vitripennis]